MKKKIFLTILCLLLVAVCLVGCVDNSQQYAKINNLLNLAAYSKVEIEVEVSTDDCKLISTFEIVYESDFSTTINFNIQRMATFDDNQPLPDSFIKNYRGSAKINRSNNQIVSVDGDLPKDVQLEKIDNFMLFNQNYFSGVKFSEGNFYAKVVTAPQMFLGDSDFVCQPNSMSVNVSYSNLIDDIRIQYISENGATVVLTYTFTA